MSDEGVAFGGAKALRLSVGEFEGPLDLLLHLIRKHELDILDIPISLVTAEYLAYLDAMAHLQLDVAGEYLVMAATLLHIKSRMLLPKRDALEEEGDDYQEDPRKALVARLLEYQRYRDAALALTTREIEGRDVFRRPSRADRYRAENQAELVPLDLFTMLSAFQKMLESRPAEVLHEVEVEHLSVQETIGHVASYLDDHPRCTLEDLVNVHGDPDSRRRLVVTFLALLEMAKLKMVRIFQAQLTDTGLIVERAVIEERERLSLPLITSAVEST